MRGNQSISARSLSHRLRAAFWDSVQKLGLQRAGFETNEAGSLTVSINADVNVAKTLLAADEALLRSERTFRDLVDAIDRIAGADAKFANNLRRAFGIKLFVPLAGDLPLASWLCRDNGWTEIIVQTPAEPADAVRAIVAALKGDAGRIATPSVVVAYAAALADIPTRLVLGDAFDEADRPMLRDLARLPSLAAIFVRSHELKEQVLGVVPDLRGRVWATSDGERGLRGGAAEENAARSRSHSIDVLPFDRDGARSQETAGAKILWLYGSEEQSGWAYGINARRLAARLGKFRHTTGVKSRNRWTTYDIKFSFDVLIARQGRTRRVRARKSILRVGGPGPLQQVSGGDRDALKRILALADGVIVLSPELEDALSALHPRVFFIPNGIDLAEWNPAALSLAGSPRPFRAGLAASLRDESEQDLKGHGIAHDACAITGVPLLTVGRGVNRVPHDRMIKDFYSQIDVLIHPTGPGKEACSNVIMEALALGIPVITTRYAGMHGQLLENGREALVMPRFALSFAAALRKLKDDKQFRQSVAAAGRRFAERLHDLDSVGRQYEQVFDIVLRTN